MLDRVRGRARVERPWDDRRASAYQILGVEPQASPQVIRRAYLGLVRMWHPDRFADEPLLRHEAEVATKRINEAYEVLSRRTQATAGGTRRSTWQQAYRSSGREYATDPYRTSAWDTGGSARRVVVVTTVLLLSLMMSIVMCYVTYALEHIVPSSSAFPLN